MTDLTRRLETLPELLRELAERYRVPGAALAVQHDGAVFETATGVLNRSTGVSVTTDSVFQIGSITKLFTTTLMMQLVDEGRVELDAPVREYLPAFRVADSQATRGVTIRQLLTHTSGIDGDYFLDTGRGDDCVERFVLACGALPQLHAAGAGWSYCNAGFVIAGRIIEVLRGQSWDRVLRERLLDPLGNRSMGTLPEEALLQRAAVGHVTRPGEREPQPAPVWVLQRSNGPAGSTPFGTAADLLRFAALHVEGGICASGARVLSADAVAEMQREQVRLPPHNHAATWGLGWMRFEWGAERLIGHDGGTIGQNAYLRVAPDRRTAVALLTNGGNPQALYRKIYNHVLGELVSVSLPALPEDNPAHGLDLQKYVGTYQRLSDRADVSLEDGALVVRVTSINTAEGEVLERPALTLLPIDAETMVQTVPGTSFRDIVNFTSLDAAGRPGGFFNSRLHPRIR